eukprot:TRINITY_DN946_c0_g1_i2.p1 TRINITY_DN946_c0_g1~~TRINITY_DN946_c0_g1_i2.p1  ORF type:complete len:232 (-),score=50.28 TRINITY_DN946_c0_g1_i2:27-722(-)
MNNILGAVANAMGGGSHHAQGGQLTVQVLEGRNLANKDLFSKSDPYCVLSIHHKSSFQMFGSEHKTNVVNNNQNPVWNQTFTLPVTNPETDLLRIKVKDSDPGRDDTIGEVDVPLFALQPGYPKNDWFQLPGSAGAIHLIITPSFGGHQQAGGYGQQPGYGQPPMQGYGQPGDMEVIPLNSLLVMDSSQDMEVIPLNSLLVMDSSQDMEVIPLSSLVMVIPLLPTNLCTFL